MNTDKGEIPVPVKDILKADKEIKAIKGIKTMMKTEKKESVILQKDMPNTNNTKASKSEGIWDIVLEVINTAESYKYAISTTSQKLFAQSAAYKSESLIHIREQKYTLPEEIKTETSYTSFKTKLIWCIFY